MTSDHPHPRPKPSTHWVFPCNPVHHANAPCFLEMYSCPVKDDRYSRPHEVEQNTNYRMWNLVSREIDSLVQRDSTNNSVNCNGAFSDTTGNSRCSLCFPFLVLSCLFAFFVSYDSLRWIPTVRNF